MPWNKRCICLRFCTLGKVFRIIFQAEVNGILGRVLKIKTVRRIEPTDAGDQIFFIFGGEFWSALTLSKDNQQQS